MLIHYLKMRGLPVLAHMVYIGFHKLRVKISLNAKSVMAGVFRRFASNS